MMMLRRLGRLFAMKCLVVLCCGFAQADDTLAIQFNRDIRPILSANCFGCHGPDKNTREADLQLNTKQGIFGKTESGEFAVLANNVSKSILYQRIVSDDPDQRMPPPETEKKLELKQIDLIRRWIQQGAVWQGHWAFEPPHRSILDVVKNENWIHNPVDHFILSRLEKEGLRPSPAADNTTLLRRLSFDLTGLPPTPVEVDAFVNDTRPQTYERAVDSLLESKHYGERMAMHWLDLVRYADSGGYHSDNEHSISPYRDYVIHAFNDNMPFDRFTREQLAGDLLLNPSIEQITATGYNRLNKTTEEGGAQPAEYLVKYAADRVRTTAGAWLGATMGCAECHDHKYDPYTMQDFYSLAAFFADVDEVGKYGGGGKRPPEITVPNRQQAAMLKKLDAEIATLKQIQNTLAKGQKDKAQSTQSDDVNSQKIVELQKRKQEIEKQFTKTMITVAVKPREIRILPRGNWLDHSGPVVTPAVPGFLSHLDHKNRRLTRLDLANWLVTPNNPLTARVFVNRMWKMFFGTGISKRLDDVGAQGEWPSHPKLLDWLAIEFIESGWNVKHIVKLLVMSNTYRQSSLSNEKLREADPMNRFYARQSRWRLDAEMIRDNSLAVSGLLVRTVGGRSVKPYQPKGYWSHLNFPTRSWKQDAGENLFRRGLYTHWQRTFLHPSLLAFDAPSREECTAERPISNTPQAALALLNDPTYVESSRVFAVKIIQKGGSSVPERISWAWQKALSRNPQKRELSLLTDLFKSNLEHYRQDETAAKGLLSNGSSEAPKQIVASQLAAWTAVARVILNLNETITRN
jgi:hypothetical protein